jgi:CubicO group peptidase (beta-lactamase class C family)
MKVLKVILIVTSVIAVLYGALVVYAYIPSPKFEPADYEPIRPDYWPTDEFRTSTPEEQGMDSAKLVEMVNVYQENHAKNSANAIDSITIVRNGYVVADIYLDPLYPPDTKHVMHSSAKSIVPALVGIAIEQGYIESVDVPVIEFFQDRAFEITDERIKEVTRQDLLTMRTGIRARDSVYYQYEGLWKMLAADDFVAYFFSLPLDAEPGTRFDYSSLAYFMVAAIIEQTTGMDPVSYARENLFDPLGIDDITWATNPDDLGLGFAPMWMKPYDMAKFGLLYLQKGQWDGQQIVPADWIEESVYPYAYPKNYVDILDENGKMDAEASRAAWISYKLLIPFSDGYGYMWRLDKNGSYNAFGTAGQYLIVAPEENMVVMVTNSSTDLGPFFPGKLFNDYILRAVQSDGGIAANQAAHDELVALSAPPTLDQEPQAVAELPATALDISGKTYSLETNNWNKDNYQLVFDPARDYAVFSFTARVDEVASIQVGLDGVYRFSETESGGYAAFGTWTSANTFEIHYQHIGYSAPSQLSLSFDRDRIQVTEISVTGSTAYSGKIEQTK